MRRATAHPLSPPATPLFGWGLGLLVVLLLTVSPLGLVALGWQYGETGGSPLEKFHPGTFLAIGLFLLVAALRGNPLRVLMDLGTEHPLVVVYLAGVAGLILHAAFVVGLPASVFVDTFVLPVVTLFLFRDLPDSRRHALALLVHFIFALNTMLGLAEFALDFRLTPLYIEGHMLEQEWRSSAFMGHPLANALLTGSYLLLLMRGGARDLPPILRPAAFLLAAAGMVVFGGRAATALVVLAALVVGLMRAGALLRGARFDPRSLLAALAVVPVVIVAVAGLLEAGFFDEFIGRISNDDGSASTRIEMFELFKHLTWYDLLMGPDPRFISTLMRIYGLDYGIESFWIAMILGHGLIVALPFFVALLCFNLEIARGTGSGGVMALVYFFAVASTSLSLSAKSPVFGIFVMLVMLLVQQSGRTVSEPLRPAPPADLDVPVRLSVAR